jgi:hypothetical protein
LALQENAKFDHSVEVPRSIRLLDEGALMEGAYQEITDERKLMTAELTEQLAQRIREHMFLKQRKETDFARAGRSETSIFERQVSSHENLARTLEQRAAEIVQNNKDKE